MESYSKILETIENNGDYASAVAEIEQEINGIPQRIETANIEIEALQEEANSYNANLPNFQANLNAARNNLNSLTKNDINEIRCFARPPNTVERVAIGVLTLLGESNLSWDGFKKFAGGNNFLALLMNLNLNNIPSQIITNLKPFIDEFQGREQEIRNVSTATYALYKWVSGVYQYSQLLSQFRPIGQIRQEINEKNQEIADLQEKLSIETNRLQELKEIIEKMNSP